MLKQINFSINLKKPEVIIFDADNTLYSYELPNLKAENAVKLFVEKKFRIDSNLFYLTYRKAKKEIKAQLGKTASSHSRLLYFQRLFEILGFKVNLKIILEMEEIFWRTYLKNAFLYPGIRELLADIKKREISTAIVTDLTSNIQMRKLIHFNLQDAFDAFVTSEEVGADKPNPKIFKLLLKKLDLTKKSYMWMVGDNPKTDIIGGKNIGAVTFQRIEENNKESKGKYRPDFTFTDFNDIRGFF